MILTVELHKALFGKDKIKPNKWEEGVMNNLWSSYVEGGKFEKRTKEQRELLKKIIKKYCTKKKKGLQTKQRTE